MPCEVMQQTVSIPAAADTAQAVDYTPGLPGSVTETMPQN